MADYYEIKKTINRVRAHQFALTRLPQYADDFRTVGKVAAQTVFDFGLLNLFDSLELVQLFDTIVSDHSSKNFWRIEELLVDALNRLEEVAVEE